MKKIKVLSLIWSMGAGGAQQILINYLRDFQYDDDIEFKVCVYTEPTESKYDREIRAKGYNVEYLNNPKSPFNIPYIKRYFNLAVAKEAWSRAIEEYKPDIVHVHISSLLIATMPGIIANNVPVIFDTLHSNPYRYKGRVRRAISEAFLKYGVVPICITEEQVKQAKDWYGIAQYEVLHNGIDIKNIQSKIISKDVARKKFEIDENAYVIAGVGRLNPIKRFDWLISIFKKVKEKVPNAKLVIAGDGSERKRLLQIAKSSNVKQDIQFLGNIDNVIDLYCAADVLAITSYTEASSLVAIEAQTCGLRCVMSDGVPSESIVTSNTQKLWVNATEDDWCKALLNDKYVGKPMAQKEDYEVHSMSQKLKRIYLKYYARG